MTACFHTKRVLYFDPFFDTTTLSQINNEDKSRAVALSLLPLAAAEER
jgi:hypothetical protein